MLFSGLEELKAIRDKDKSSQHDYNCDKVDGAIITKDQGLICNTWGPFACNWRRIAARKFAVSFQQQGIKSAMIGLRD